MTPSSDEKRHMEFWTRKGTNNFTHEWTDDDCIEPIKSLSRGDMFYDAVVLEPIEGGIHVIEHAALEAAQKEISILTEIKNTLGEKLAAQEKEIAGLKAENDRLALSHIELSIEHPCYKLSKELEQKNNELTAELAEAREQLKNHDRDFKAMQKYQALYVDRAIELTEAKAEIERLQQEVVNRNQYKINQEYLDNVHSHYEKQVVEFTEVIRRKDAELAELKGALKDTKAMQMAYEGADAQEISKLKSLVKELKMSLESNLNYFDAIDDCNCYPEYGYERKCSQCVVRDCTVEALKKLQTDQKGDE